MTRSKNIPSLWVSLVPVVVLMALLILNIIIFKDDATSGANQLALLFSGAVAAAIGVFLYKQKYKEIEGQILRSIKMAMQASIILLVVGALIGTWILSGIVPTMIYYGLMLINPTVFLPVACLVCCIVSLSTGSSWSTTGTIGIALIGIGKTLEIPEGMVAGAIISGAYFGDKMSPLSDTTNLAPAMAGTDLFTHIRHMMYTSIPAITIALIGFVILGLFYVGEGSNPESIKTVMNLMKEHFTISLWLLLVPLSVILMVVKKIPALPAIIAATILGAIFALIFQWDLITKISAENPIYKTVITIAYSGFDIKTGNELIDSLLNRGGMKNMLGTVWLIMMAMVFGGALEGTGMLGVLAGSIMKFVRGAGTLIGATLASCLVLNMTACDQYLSIVVPGRMFKKSYDDMKLHPKNLSRSLEDAGTVTSVLIPWNSGGAYNSGVLGVPTLTYLPYCFFNLCSPLVSGFLAGFNLTIDRVKENNQGSNDDEQD